MLIAAYIPNPENAAVAAFLQFIIIGVLWLAMFSYARPRRGALCSAMVLSLGILVSNAVVLIPYIRECDQWCRNWSESSNSDAFWILVSYFELYEFAVVSFIGLVSSLVILMIVLFFVHPAAKQQEKIAKIEGNSRTV